MSRRLLPVVLVAVAVLTAACSGMDRAEFDAEVQARGGGLGTDVPADGLEELEEVLGEEPVLRSLAHFAGYVTFDVLVPGTDDELDSYVYGTTGAYGHGLGDPTPLTGVPGPGELRRSLFRAGRVPVDDFDEIVDAALAEADLDGGYASSLIVNRFGDDGITITVRVENERESISFTFDRNGELIGTTGRDPA